MDIHHEHTQVHVGHDLSIADRSPVASGRVKSLAERIIEGAPALTLGEMRELAAAILEHNIRSEAQADPHA